MEAPSVEALREELNGRETAEAEVVARVREARERALEPFAEEIGAVMAAYAASLGPVRGSVAAMGRGLVKEAVRRYVEAYALRMGRLPRGEHVVAWPTDRGRRTIRAIKVDFEG
jgi:hypothetical protein